MRDAKEILDHLSYQQSLLNLLADRAEGAPATARQQDLADLSAQLEVLTSRS
jgi:hypothetical protein